ncbi:hypothetical protein [Lederbergia panacisoli]|uniref:hypothetical protein n=1 Tax=Lederbergia panacisoli TaxID=1255251 RepID=UPI00214ABBA2|nr:hypothetical protein [Lederbergia panacisoli]MCR2821221.1 hypothetical protein [Lederbergia panacisoli]
MMNLYTVEKRMKYEEMERQRKANQAWMFPRKKRNKYFKSTLHEVLELAFQKSIAFKKRSRKMFDS